MDDGVALGLGQPRAVDEIGDVAEVVRGPLAPAVQLQDRIDVPAKALEEDGPVAGPLDLADDGARPVGRDMGLAAEDDGVAGVIEQNDPSLRRPEDRGLEEGIDAAEILPAAVESQRLDGLEGV
ncbi:MAG: hypothetical protein MZV64_14370 [Ignavibacteriales bacterium]|nr:hypothetical protein [Ignavibacteriales bacterium]